MKAADRLLLEKALSDALHKYAAGIGPGKHTVWRTPCDRSQFTNGFLVYRATMKYQTPIVIWIDDVGEETLHLTLVLTNPEGNQLVSSYKVRDASDLLAQVQLLK